MPRKPKPLPIPEEIDPKHRFNTILTALLAVKKDELQRIDAKIEEIRKHKQRRRRSRTS